MARARGKRRTWTGATLHVAVDDWASAYGDHVELVRKARKAKMRESIWEDPLMQEGDTDDYKDVGRGYCCIAAKRCLDIIKNGSASKGCMLFSRVVYSDLTLPKHGGNN